MRLTVPDYYDRFRCIASRCTDNCCIGWEIGIDPAALADYQSQPGAFGDRLRAAIQPGDPPYFALTEAGRCPFLNSENLCDIYRQLGETHLCTICDQHPRFHNWFGAEKESGLGLSCEEAARLILFSAPPRLISRDIAEAPDPDGPDPELLAGLRAVRETAFALLREAALPLALRLALLAGPGPAAGRGHPRGLTFGIPRPAAGAAGNPPGQSRRLARAAGRAAAGAAPTAGPSSVGKPGAGTGGSKCGPLHALPVFRIRGL